MAYTACSWGSEQVDLTVWILKITLCNKSSVTVTLTIVHSVYKNCSVDWPVQTCFHGIGNKRAWRWALGGGQVSERDVVRGRCVAVVRGAFSVQNWVSTISSLYHPQFIDYLFEYLYSYRRANCRQAYFFLAAAPSWKDIQKNDVSFDFHKKDVNLDSHEKGVSLDSHTDFPGSLHASCAWWNAALVCIQVMQANLHWTAF